MKHKNKRIKLAFVYDAIYPYVKGGAEKRNYEISTRLAKKGYEVHIYGMKWWEGKNIIKKDGVYLHGICKSMPLYTKKGIRSIRQAIYFGLNCFKLIKEDFDVIDIDHMPFFSLFSMKVVCLLKRKKMFVTWNEVWGREYWKKYLGKLGNIAYIIEWLSSRMPDEIISISEHTSKKLKNDLGIKKNIYTIPMGIDIELINSIKPSSKKSDVIYAGRLLEHKNVDYLIKSISLLKKDYPNIKCLIVGKGPEEKKLKLLTDNLNLQKNIIFYDFLENQNDLYALMKSSKVFALPSFREGFGIVTLEANACGIPVITTDHQDNASKNLIIDGKNGHKITLSEKNIALKVKELLKSTSNDFGKISNYDWNKITKKTEEVYSL